MKHVGDAALDFYCRPNLSWTRGEGGVWGTLEVSLGCKPGKRGKPETMGCELHYLGELIGRAPDKVKSPV